MKVRIGSCQIRQRWLKLVGRQTCLQMWPVESCIALRRLCLSVCREQISRMALEDWKKGRSGCHAIISDEVWSAEGEFLELSSLETATVCQLFRRLLLARLHQRNAY